MSELDFSGKTVLVVGGVQWHWQWYCAWLFKAAALMFMCGARAPRLMIMRRLTALI